MNLLEETVFDISTSGHSVSDIIFIGSELTGHRCSWEEFKVLADRDYDDGFGSQKVANDLVIVFSDKTVLRRDGSEGWEFIPHFEMPAESAPIHSLFCGVGNEKTGWCSLAELNR